MQRGHVRYDFVFDFGDFDFPFFLFFDSNVRTTFGLFLHFDRLRPFFAFNALEWIMDSGSRAVDSRDLVRGILSFSESAESEEQRSISAVLTLLRL